MTEKQSLSMNEFGEKGSANLKELLDLLEEYNKYMEQVNQLYDVFSEKGIIVVPSTTSGPAS